MSHLELAALLVVLVLAVLLVAPALVMGAAQIAYAPVKAEDDDGR